MKKNFFCKKIVTAFAFVLISTANIFALPFVKNYLEDFSGNFVFYRDYTFTEESYIGFLTYGQGAYAIRYYKPASKENNLERDITVYITIDENEKDLKMTGETINGAYKNEDVDIVNYIHDLMYSLTAARQKVDLTSGKEQNQNAKIDVFGGDVKISYSPLVPIFNVYSINKTDGKKLFETVITGCMTSNGDKTFADFKGKTSTSDKKRKLKLKKNAEEIEIKSDGMKISIDKNWTKAVDNLYLLGDVALLSFAPVKTSSKDFDFEMANMERYIYYSSDSAAFVDWRTKSKKTEGGKTTFVTYHFNQKENYLLKTYSVLLKGKDSLELVRLSVYESAYEKNKAYFDGILSGICAGE